MRHDDEEHESGVSPEEDQRASKQEGLERGDDETPPKPGGGKQPQGGERGTEAG